MKVSLFEKELIKRMELQRCIWNDADDYHFDPYIRNGWESLANDLRNDGIVNMTVPNLKKQWNSLRQWWLTHQKKMHHVKPGCMEFNIIGICPISSERCIAMSFLHDVPKYDNLYWKHFQERATRR